MRLLEPMSLGRDVPGTDCPRRAGERVKQEEPLGRGCPRSRHGDAPEDVARLAGEQGQQFGFERLVPRRLLGQKGEIDRGRGSGSPI